MGLVLVVFRLRRTPVPMGLWAYAVPMPMSKSVSARGLCWGRSEGGDSEVLVTIVIRRRRRRSTGEHGCRTFACGHLTCTLASVEDGCEECRIVAQKAEMERISK